MKSMAFLFLVAGLLSGCFSPPTFDAVGYTPPGQSTVQVGQVAVDQVLRYSGRLVPIELAVLVDENGNTILSTGAEETGELSIYLAEDARQALLANLYKTRKIGAETGMASANSEENVGTVASSSGPSVPNSIRISYIFREYGSSWGCLLDLSGYDRNTIMTSHIGMPEGRRDMRLFLSPDAVNALLRLIEQAPGLSPSSAPAN